MSSNAQGASPPYETGDTKSPIIIITTKHKTNNTQLHRQTERIGLTWCTGERCWAHVVGLRMRRSAEQREESRTRPGPVRQAINDRAEQAAVGELSQVRVVC